MVRLVRHPAARLRDVLNDRYRQEFVFIHINKTAGSSIGAALGVRPEHRTALEKRALIGRRNWERKFRFAFVRNPWDRAASHFHYRVKTNQTGLGDHPITFAEWVDAVYRVRDPRFYDNPKMFQPQIDWIVDVDGRCLVDFVGRFERLEGDFQTVCRQLGRPAIALPHVKKSPERRNYRDEYDAETAAVIERCFRRDIEAFDYEF